jgi:hypothetical protein
MENFDPNTQVREIRIKDDGTIESTIVQAPEGYFYSIPTIDSLKAKKWEEIKSARNSSEVSGFSWDGSVFDSDQISQAKIQGAALAALISIYTGKIFSIDWTLADNTVRSLSATEMIAVGEAMLTHINSVHERGRLLREQITSITESTVQNLSAISWEA